jgi:hypothetical protein
MVEWVREEAQSFVEDVDGVHVHIQVIESKSTTKFFRIHVRE